MSAILVMFDVFVWMCLCACGVVSLVDGFGISLLDEFSGLSVLLFTPGLGLNWIYAL